MTAAVSKRDTACVYRLRGDIPAQDQLAPIERDLARQLIEEYLADIPHDMAERWKAGVAKEAASLRRMAAWAPTFIDAYYDGSPLPLLTPKKKVTHVARNDWAAMTSREAALQAVLDNRQSGLTAAEARIYTGIDGSGLGGALSLLDQAGVLARIHGERRSPNPLITRKA